MLEFLIDSIFVMLGGRVSCRIVPLFIWGRLHIATSQLKQKYQSFNFTFHRINDVFSLYNSMFGDFDDHIYPIELEIKDTTDTTKSASSLDLHFEIASACRLRTKLDDKWNYFNFPIVNFPSLCSNIPEAPAYGVYISKLIRYSRVVVPIRISLIEGCC